MQSNARSQLKASIVLAKRGRTGAMGSAPLAKRTSETIETASAARKISAAVPVADWRCTTQRAGVGARFVAFRANPDDLAARAVDTWATAAALAELPALLGL